VQLWASAANTWARRTLSSAKTRQCLFQELDDAGVAGRDVGPPHSNASTGHTRARPGPGDPGRRRPPAPRHARRSHAPDEGRRAELGFALGEKQVGADVAGQACIFGHLDGDGEVASRFLVAGEPQSVLAAFRP